jgi:hypothetical protein
MKKKKNNKKVAQRKISKKTKTQKTSNKKRKVISKNKSKLKLVVKKLKSKPAKKVIQITLPIEKEKPKGTMYFTNETQEGVIAYNKATSQGEKDVIYNTLIRYAFEKIAENVYNTFKFSYADVSPLEIQKQCISHMVANIDKYDPSKGKAFGYFSIVAKHWFILDNNNTYRRFKRHVEICEHPGDSGEFVVEPEHTKKDNETREFIKLMVDFWDTNVCKYFNKDRDIKIANAVVEIFRNCDRIDVFNKKALYLYIREIADCQTQHITKVINKMKYAQKNISNEYQDHGTVTGEGIYA